MEGDMQLEYINLQNIQIFDKLKNTPEQEEELASSLKQIFINNKLLIHLDLSNTGLTEDIIFEMMGYIKASA